MLSFEKQEIQLFQNQILVVSADSLLTFENEREEVS